MSLSLQDHKIVWASGGKMHSLAVTSTGDAWAFGSNKHGQLGVGSIKIRGSDDGDVSLVPVKSAISNCQRAAAGAEFSMWLCNGALFSAGLPQYGQVRSRFPNSIPPGNAAHRRTAACGPLSPSPSRSLSLPRCVSLIASVSVRSQTPQLGHGTDHEYNMKEGSVKLAYAAQPTPKAIQGALAGVKVAKMATGTNHTVAIDEAGKIYTWGNGGYGRLGHKEQKDEFAPRMVPVQGGERNACPPDAICAAGSLSTWISAAQGQVYFWGKARSLEATRGDRNRTGENRIPFPRIP